MTVIVDGPDEGAKSSVSDSPPQPIANHNLPENSVKHTSANQVESNADQDLSNVSKYRS